MRRALIVANWKMYGRREFIRDYLRDLSGGLFGPTPADLTICPPAVYLGELTRYLPAAIETGAQDCSPDRGDGAYTGEISASMFADMGCRWVIVGHSERRHRLHEDNSLVTAKFAAVLAAGIQPILCVGETAEERASGHAESVVLAQLESVLDTIEIGGLARAVIAYEPVWAIGSGAPATPADAQAMHRLLRHAVERRSPRVAGEMRIIYGGSVKPQNAAGFFRLPDVDGALIGGASLNAGMFLEVAFAAGTNQV